MAFGGSTFFPYRIDRPFRLDGSGVGGVGGWGLCTGKQTERHKNYLSCQR